MEKVVVPYISDLEGLIKNKEPALSKFSKIHINQCHWNEPFQTVQAQVYLAHNNGQLGLCFYVEEPYVLAEKVKDFENVYEDSCVEFFFKNDENSYINFEWNCLGYCLCQTGKERANRSPLGQKLLNQIFRESSLQNQTSTQIKSNKNWNLKLLIPLCQILNKPLKGIQLKANFYKCGDKLPLPHYLSWNSVLTEKPDFHRPEFFGSLVFE